MRKTIIILTFYLFIFNVSSQIYKNKNYGIYGGILVNIGTTFNRIGVNVGAYYIYEQAQINVRISSFYNSSTIGHSKKGFETLYSVGGIFVYGKSTDKENTFFSITENNIERKNSIIIVYNYYVDNAETTQPSGIIGFQINNFYIIHENDILGKQASDRYRTAGTLLAYKHGNIKYGINSLLWTGNSNNIKTHYDENYPAHYGYRDLSKSKYGKFSNGILSFQVQYTSEYAQLINFELGIDSEYVRHMLQNKFMHDMNWIPKKWNGAQNPHYPMLDTNGMPYLYREGQKVKKSKLYLDMSINKNLFY